MVCSGVFEYSSLVGLKVWSTEGHAVIVIVVVGVGRENNDFQEQSSISIRTVFWFLGWSQLIMTWLQFSIIPINTKLPLRSLVGISCENCSFEGKRNFVPDNLRFSWIFYVLHPRWHWELKITRRRSYNRSLLPWQQPTSIECEQRQKISFLQVWAKLGVFM